jgi:hypothetical protein
MGFGEVISKRREFITKHLPKAIGGGVTSLMVAVGILTYRADEAKEKLKEIKEDSEKDIKALDRRVRHLEEYNSSNVAQIQILLSDRHRHG